MARFRCTSCGEWHEGVPTYGFEAPVYYYAVPENERATRCSLGTDDCVIDGEHFFVRGSLEIPVHGESETFSWGVWVSLSRDNFLTFVEYFDQPRRSHVGPFFGWLSNSLPLYPDTVNLKTMAHLRDDGVRPYIELEPTDHPLAVEQRQGISVQRVAEIYSHLQHGNGA